MAADILKGMAKPNDWFKPLWASGVVIRQPNRQLTAGIYSFPEQYIPLLKAPELVRASFPQSQQHTESQS
jgi:hypothetical protein